MNKKTPEIGAQTRAQIAERLPQAIEKALESYHDFTDGVQSVDESKEFQNRHTAAKAALAHIELLLKLASLVDAMGEDHSGHIRELLEAARGELEGKT